MSIQLAPQYTQRFYQWTAWKDQQLTKNGIFQFDDDGVIYTIYFYDGPEVIMTNIWKGTVPDSATVNYSQVQNDVDKADFEANFLSNANLSTGNVRVLPLSPLVINAYTTTSGSSFTAVRATTFAEMLTPQTRSVKSTSIFDFLSGSGGQQLLITYYDSNLNGPYTETMYLSGTSANSTISSNICFIERLDVTAVGAQLGNVGSISIYSGSGGAGTIMAQIAAGDNQTYYAHHYVSPSKTARISDVVGFINGLNGGVLTLRTTNPLTASVPEKTIAEALHLQPGDQEHYDATVPATASGPARLLLYAKADGSPGLMNWTVGFNLFEVVT